MKQKFGFLRESTAKAIKAGIDKDTGLHRTGLDEYLKVIYPETTDWIYDKAFGWHNEVYYRIRPDYRSESLKLVIEVDGLPHYQNPDVIMNDTRKDEIYNTNGYTIVRIPYFIQLTNDAVYKLFNIIVPETLFIMTNNTASFSINCRCTPAYLCHMGVQRLKNELVMFPKQYKINIEALKAMNNDTLSGLSLI